MRFNLSLANKCLLLFGLAAVLIIVAALTVPWIRMHLIQEEAQRDLSRRLVDVYERHAREYGQWEGGAALIDAEVSRLEWERFAEAADDDRFVRRAVRRFERDPGRVEHFGGWWAGTTRQHQYARAYRGQDGDVEWVVVLARTYEGALRHAAVNLTSLFSAGLIALGLAVLVFYLITNRLILGPVRELKATTERVGQGDLSIRSEISTGDEFEQLSETFNRMLEALEATQEQLRATNASLDVRLNELAERNLVLHEANRLKGEFVANVSHELRTPLNSIIGFAELLADIAEREAAAGDDSTRLARRRRYLRNIITSGRSLLEMINGLLEMARIEAGRVELRTEPTDVRDMCERLLAMIRPLADKNGVELRLEIGEDIPIVHTDVRKLEQVVFNLLSNAVKFSGDPEYEEKRADGERMLDPYPPGQRSAKVTLRAERLVATAGEGPSAEDRVRISVLDTGPGIEPEHLEVIFEKFRQIESGHTRRYAGTGLGLAISKELTSILQGEIQVESEPGRGSMFSVIVPLRIDELRAEEMKLEMAFRGSLAGYGRAEGAAQTGPQTDGENDATDQ